MISARGRSQSAALRERLGLRNTSNANLDRFIPNRAAMDMDYARFMIAGGMEPETSNPEVISPRKAAYRRLLAEALGINRSRILSFNDRPHSGSLLFRPLESLDRVKPKPLRHIPQTSEKTLDAPDIIDDFYLNLLDWGMNNVIAIGLGDSVYFWNASDGSTSELVTVDEEDGPITSVQWDPDGRHIAVGLSSAETLIFDGSAEKHVNTLTGCHRGRIGSLAWNRSILTTGGLEGNICNNDVRIRDHIVRTYRGHSSEVCGLRWSPSGRHLASGGDDNRVFIWDNAMSPSRSATRWLRRFEEHVAAVKALAWCPFVANAIASGSGGEDGTIKIWNSSSGACMKSVETGSQVCGLAWSSREKELVSCHGHSDNVVSLWKYPTMKKMADLTGHTSRVLYMAESPNGCTVATASGDESMRLWNVFGDPGEKRPKLKPKPYSEPFSNFTCSIR